MEIWVVDQYGIPVDLTGATVKVYGTQETAFFGRTWPETAASPDAPDINGATCTPDADRVTNKGLCSWVPVAGDTDVVGTFAAQVRVVFSGGGVRHFPPSLGQRVIVVGSGINP